jgi:hypothetical protein
VHLFAQATFRANAEAVANDQHTNDQCWIDRRSARVAVVRSKVLVQFAQIDELVDTAQQAVGWTVVFKVERVEQRRLPDLLTTHHPDEFRSTDGESVDQLHVANSIEFFNGIGRERTRFRTSASLRILPIDPTAMRQRRSAMDSRVGASCGQPPDSAL